MTLGEESNNKFYAACAIPNKNQQDGRLKVVACRSRQKFDLENLIMDIMGFVKGYPKWWRRHPGGGPLGAIDSSLKLSTLNNFLLVSFGGIQTIPHRDLRYVIAGLQSHLDTYSDMGHLGTTPLFSR